MGVFLHMFRPLNLLLMGVAQYLSFLLIEVERIAFSWDMAYLLIAATVAIGASGNVINDVYDIQTDRISNRKKWVVTSAGHLGYARILFALLFAVGAGLGIFAGQLAHVSAAAALSPAICGLLLWWYSASLQHKPFTGNVLVSVLTAVVVLLPLLFVSESSEYIESILVVLASLAFLSSMIREVSKDVEDREADLAADSQSIGVKWSLVRIKKLLFLLWLIMCFALIPLVVYGSVAAKIWVVIIGIGYIRLLLDIQQSANPEGFKKVSRSARLVMGLGLMWIVFNLPWISNLY